MARYTSLINCRSKIASSFFLSAILACGSAFSAEKIYHYSIAAQSLNNALVKFAIESNLALVFTANMVRGLRSKALFGEMTSKAALEKLLHGSGYSYRFVDLKTVTLMAKAEVKSAESKQLIAKQIVVPDTIEILRPMTVFGKDKDSSNVSWQLSGNFEQQCHQNGHSH